MELFSFHLMPWPHLPDDFEKQHDSAWVWVPNALYDPERDRGLATTCFADPSASGLSFLALVLWLMGYPDRARQTADAASRHAAELAHANTTALVLYHA